MRTAITSLPPLFPDLGTRLHLSSAALSVLAATPVICFGVVSAFAAWLNRRYGEEAILLVALALLTAGLLLPFLVLAQRDARSRRSVLQSTALRRWQPVSMERGPNS